MCTLTIRRNKNNILVTMNRDEQRTRTPEQPPFLWQTPIIFAPQDRQSGGTWLGINQQGDIAALLNGYQSEDQAQTKKSRGEIVPMVLSGKNIKPETYASFHLVVIKKGIVIHSYWDGQAYQENRLAGQEWYFLTSSGWNQAVVKSIRQAQFEKWLSQKTDLQNIDSQEAGFEDHLPAIHWQQKETQKAHSVLMAREDACTKSITQFQSAEGHSICRYWKNPHQSRDFHEYQGLFEPASCS